MANIIKRVWNQNRMVQIEDLKGMTFQAEQAGHTFQISGVDDDGNTVALTGTPAGVLLRPDNTDVALTCSVSGGVVSATLPANCYDVPGRFGLTIFITSGSSKTAIYAAVGTVTRTSSGTAAPGTTQSVVDLINAINAAINSIPASYSALLADIAPIYSNSALYSVGQYAWYDGDLKRCIVPITTAESYTAAHWTSAVLGQDVSDLKSAINQVDGATLLAFESGGMYEATGIEYPSSTKSITAFVRVNPGDTYHFCFDIDGIRNISVFEFASDTTTGESINERLAVTAIYEYGEVTLTNGTNYVRVQINVATSDIVNPVIMLNGGFLGSMFDTALHFRGVLPSGSVNAAADMTGIWQLISANTYTDLPYDGAIGWLEVIKTNTWSLLRFTNGTAEGIWIKRKVSNTWSSWAAIKSGLNSLDFDDYLINSGAYIINADDLESGFWNCSTKQPNDARARTKILLPVRAGMMIDYTNTTFDTFFGVLATQTSSAYIQTIGWKTDGRGVISITQDGWLTFVIRNHADTSATVDPADYDSVVAINTVMHKLTHDLSEAVEHANACLYAADGYSSGLIDMMLSVDGKWTNPGTSNHIMIPVKGGDSVSITNNYAYNALFGVLTDYDSPINGVNAKFSVATGYTGRIPVSNSSQVFVMPDDARYIAINASINGNNYLPLSVKINGTERLNGINEYVKEIDGTIDVLQKYGSHISRSVNGITFAWSDDKKSCTVSGESSAIALTNLYYSETEMPAWLCAGATYRMMVKCTQPGVSLDMTFYAGTEQTSVAVRDNTEITIPSNATGCQIRLFVASGTTLDSVITIGMSKELPNDDLSNLYFDNLNKSDYVLSYCKTITETINGITYDWYGVTQRKCRITGEATAFSIYTLYDDRLPVGMNIGDPFIVKFDTWPVIGLSFNAIVRFYDKDDNELLLVRGTNNRIDIPFTVPYNAYRWRFEIYVTNGTTINVTLETLQVVKLKRKNTLPRRFFSIVDDDTSTNAFVTRFHDACMHNGIRGNYAVLTDRLDLGDTSPDKLLSYEDEGFGMLVHASDQSMERVPEWAITNRTAAETQVCMANLAKGLRKMQEYGFIDYKHWITPGGHFEKDLKAIARSFGLEGLYSIGNGRHNTMQDVDKYCIKRVSFHPTDDTQDGSVAGMKDFIDKTASDTAGWLIITTHFNEWGGLTWDDTLDANGYPVGYARFNEVVQYALNAGLVPMSVPQAWTYYKPILEANLKECNELF